jgi:subtilisin family serine protease
LGVLLAVVMVSPVQAGEIDPDFQGILDNTPNDQVVSALVYLQEQVDSESLVAQLHARNANRATRNQVVVEALYDLAQRTQPDLVQHLLQLEVEGRVLQFEPMYIANVIRVDAVPAEIIALADRPEVGTIYYNYFIESIAPVEEPVIQPSGGDIQMAAPEVGVRAVRAPEVWAMGFTGQGILVATLDTGVDGNHPALASRWRGLDSRYAGNPGWAWFDPVTNTTFPQAFGSHGTHTMGSVCGGLPGEEVGVAPGAQWIHAAVIDRVSIPRTVSDAILSFQWMLNPDGDTNTSWDVPNVCSNSWGVTTGHGYPPCDQTFWVHLDNSEAAGTVQLFSAGNEGTSGLRRPADRATTDYDSCAVAAVDANNPNWPIAGFSSRGPTNCTPGGGPAIKPDISAPGVNVRSSLPGGGYGNNSGTSMASPHVNGVVALMLSANPELLNEETKQIFYETAFNLGDDEGEDNAYGWGMIDAFRATEIALARRTIRFLYPNGRPETIDPNGGTRMRVDVVGNDKVDPEPGSGRFNFHDGNDWVELTMIDVGENQYEAVFPPYECEKFMNYYLSAETTEGERVTDPFSAPDNSFLVQAMLGTQTFFTDDFQTDQGWTVTNENVRDGAWLRADPCCAGGGAPSSDYDGSGRCYLTGNALFKDVDGGPTRLTSPAFDLAGKKATVDHAIWFTGAGNDWFDTDVSNDDGATWVRVQRLSGGTQGWDETGFAIADYVQPTSDVRIRFSVRDEDPDNIVEGAVDAFTITETLCGDEGQPVLPISFEVTAGNLIGGTIDELIDSDDAYVNVEARRPSELAASSVEIEVTGTAPADDPAVLTFKVESHSTGAPVHLVIDLYDYDAGMWVRVEDRTGTPSDTEVRVRIDTDAGRFIQNGDMEMKARVGYVDYSVPAVGWNGMFDMVGWAIVQ